MAPFLLSPLRTITLFTVVPIPVYFKSSDFFYALLVSSSYFLSSLYNLSFLRSIRLLQHHVVQFPHHCGLHPRGRQRRSTHTLGFLASFSEYPLSAHISWSSPRERFFISIASVPSSPWWASSRKFPIPGWISSYTLWSSARPTNWSIDSPARQLQMCFPRCARRTSSLHFHRTGCTPQVD